MHTRVAGSGVQVPFGDIPSDVHTAIIFPVGTNPVLHLKNISAPPSVFGTVTMEPLSGAAGIPQLTERKNSGNRNILKTIAHIRCCTLFRRENVVLVVQYHVISTHAGYWTAKDNVRRHNYVTEMIAAVKCPCLIVSQWHYGGITLLTPFTAVGKTEIGLWKTRVIWSCNNYNNKKLETLQSGSQFEKHLSAKQGS